VDDIFTLNKTRFLEFSKALIDLNVKWFCEARVDSIDDTILDQMVKTGCTTVNLGIESVEDKVLEKIKKKQTVAMAKEAIQKIHARHMKVKIYLIYGLPFESKDIVQKTMDFIRETKPDYVSLFTITPYPGTDMWDTPERYNIKHIDTDFNRYQHSIGGKKEELDWLPSIEYYDRTKEHLRYERNILKKFTMSWNGTMSCERERND